MTHTLADRPNSPHGAWRLRCHLALLAGVSAAGCAKAPEPAPRQAPPARESKVSTPNHPCGIQSAKSTPDGIAIRFASPTRVSMRRDGKFMQVMIDSTSPAASSAASLKPADDTAGVPEVLALPGERIGVFTSAHSGCDISAVVQEGKLGLAVKLGVSAPGLAPFQSESFIPAGP